MERIYLEDIEAGEEFLSSRRTLTEADIAYFSGISGDRSPLHSDETFIRESTPFRGRIAQGWLIVSIQSGLRSRLDAWEILAWLEVNCRWRAPAYPGDTLQARYTVNEVRPSRSKPDRGVVTLGCEVVNQEGEVVQTSTETYLVGSRVPRE